MIRDLKLPPAQVVGVRGTELQVTLRFHSGSTLSERESIHIGPFLRTNSEPRK